MPVLYVTEMDAVLRKHQEALVVSRAGEELSRVPLPQVEQVVLLGPVSISTQVLTHFLVHGIDCVFCSADGKYIGRLVADESSFGAIRITQSAHAGQEGHRLDVARGFVVGKTRNQMTMIRRQNRKRAADVLRDVVSAMEKAMERMEEASSLDVLRGLEGEAARAYFQGFRAVLRDTMGFNVRARRPPQDPVNSMLSLGYTLLAEAARSSLHTAGLDPHLGYLHSVERSRPSLALDLMEEFRPLAVDSVVLRLVNTGAIKPEQFEDKGARMGVRMTPGGLRTFVGAFEDRMQILIRHPDAGRIPYRRVLDWQARRLAWVIQGRVPAYQAFTPR